MPSFIPIDTDSDFSIHNIPFGVFSTKENTEKRCATRIGETVVDLRELARKGVFDGLEGFSASWFAQVSTFTSVARLLLMPLRSRR
jgi:fumarylacetoacetase